MADDDSNKAEINEVAPVGPNPPEARTEPGDAHKAAMTYAGQAEKGKGTQDPYPYDPTNELLDGDDSPSRSEMAARGVQVSPSGKALVPETDPTGVIEVPPAHSNLELAKAREKHMVAADMADGIDPEIGRQARQSAREQAAKARRTAAESSSSGSSTGAEAEEARKSQPQGRSRTGGSTKG